MAEFDPSVLGFFLIIISAIFSLEKPRRIFTGVLKQWFRLASLPKTTAGISQASSHYPFLPQTQCMLHSLTTKPPTSPCAVCEDPKTPLKMTGGENAWIGKRGNLTPGSLQFPFCLFVCSAWLPSCNPNQGHENALTRVNALTLSVGDFLQGWEWGGGWHRKYSISPISISSTWLRCMKEKLCLGAIPPHICVLLGVRNR